MEKPCSETPEYFRLKSCYGTAVAERYKKLINSSGYWETTAEELLPGVTEESLLGCINLAGVRLTPAKRKKILGAIAIFPSLRTHAYRFQLTPRNLFAMAKDLGFYYNQAKGWKYLDHNIKLPDEKPPNPS
jgi:hypothetical protein